MLPVVAMTLALVTMVTSTEVTTTSGPVRGAVVEGALRFLGIPYAKPPLGALRFSPPEAPEPWSNVRETTELGPICVQPGGKDMSEDCLTLNIYLPQNEVDLTQNRAVMVWIHGGAFIMGSGSRYDVTWLTSNSTGDASSSSGDVIVVTLNYRLGVLGFFTTGNDDVRGNAGLFDQQMALKWVRENIWKFGGDTSRITIFGESSGAQSVSAHVLSPLSDGLFQRAISQSGVLHNFPTPHFTELKMAAQVFAKKHGCTDEMPAMLKCLLLMPAEKLLANAASDMYTYPPTFSVVVDGELVTKPFRDMWREWTNPHGISYMAGVNSDDGDDILQFDMASYSQRLRSGISQETFTTLSRQTVRRITTVDDSTFHLVRDQYLPGGAVNDTGRLRALLDLATDGAYLSDTISAMDATARLATPGDGQAYLYYFSHHTLAARMLSATPGYTAGHAEEIPYLLGRPYTDTGYSPEDREVALTMMTAWTTFAKTGEPIYVMSNGQTAEWPPYSTEGRKYLEIKGPMTSDSVKSRLRPRATSFWNVLLPAKNRADRGYGGSGGGCPADDSPSLITRDTAETLLFILIAVVIVLLLAAVLLLANYCSLKKSQKKSHEKKAPETSHMTVL